MLSTDGLDLCIGSKGKIARLLIAQALVEGIVLLTSDDVVAQYAEPVRLV